MNIVMPRPATFLSGALTLLLMFACEVSCQDAPPLPADKIEATEAAPVNSAGTENPRDIQQRKQQSAVAGLLVLGLLCGVFLFLILVVVLWARRIRLEATQPLPEQQPGDPLWYLKKPSAISDVPVSRPENDE